MMKYIKKCLVEQANALDVLNFKKYIIWILKIHETFCMLQLIYSENLSQMKKKEFCFPKCTAILNGEEPKICFIFVTFINFHESLILLLLYSTDCNNTHIS